MQLKSSKSAGSTLMVTIMVVAALMVLLGIAVNYSSQMSRNVERTRKTAIAMEIADGHLENLFTNWRNIYRTTWTSQFGSNTGGTDYSVVGTNYFFTSSYHPGPAPTAVPYMMPTATVPPQISLPASTLFPADSNYTVTQYRIQAVDPMITLDSNGDALVEGDSTKKGTGGYVALSPGTIPPAAYGPTAAYGIPGFPYSYYYLAAVDVQVPALAGTVTAKVRRVFEKKFDLPWNYAMFFMDDLELQPTTPFAVTGPVHTNGSLYIGTSNFTTTSRVEYGSEFTNGFSPNDSRYGNSVTAPNFAKSDSSLAISDCPPAQSPPFMPFGWNVNLSTASGSGANNDGYREIVETTSSGTDELASIRLANQAGIQIFIDSSNGVTVKYGNGTTPANAVKTAVQGAVTTNRVFYDNREGGYIRVVDLDIFALAKAANNSDIPANTASSSSSPNGWNGVVYISDTSATTYNLDGTTKTAGSNVNVTYNSATYQTTKRGIRLIKGAILPTAGLTVVSDNPAYIQGDFNTNPNGNTAQNASYAAPTPPSDSTPNASTPSSPVVSGTRKDAAIIADAITLLSSGWVDANSTGNPTSQNRNGVNTTVNAALIGGCSPSSGGSYGGGGESFVRYLEDWGKNSNYFTYYGSMIQLYRSQQAIGAWSGAGAVYKTPILRWFYDKGFLDSTPPGNLLLAAYLQQQRWYQVY
jgi:hypothetical protein